MGITDWQVTERMPGATRVEFTPLTGRTHQLRVHSAHPLGIGCPIMGDQIYGDPESAARLMLHSTTLSFNHPHTDEWMEFYLPPVF